MRFNLLIYSGLCDCLSILPSASKFKKKTNKKLHTSFPLAFQAMVVNCLNTLHEKGRVSDVVEQTSSSSKECSGAGLMQPKGSKLT